MTILARSSKKTPKWSSQQLNPRQQQEWDGPQHGQAGRDAVDRHGDDHNAQRDQHLEPVDQHGRDNQNELGQVHLGENRLVLFHQLDALLHRPVEELPGAVAQEDEGAQVVLAPAEDDAVHKGVYQHEQQRVQNPPQPVQEGTGHLILQLRLGGVEHIAAVFDKVAEKSLHRKKLPSGVSDGTAYYTSHRTRRQPASRLRSAGRACLLFRPPLYWYQEMTPKLGERMLQL